MGRQPDHVEGADQVDLNDLAEDGQGVRTGLADGFLSRCNARTVDQAPERAQGAGPIDHRLAIGFLADIARHEDRPQFLGNGLAFVDLHVGNHHLPTGSGEHSGGAFAQA